MTSTETRQESIKYFWLITCNKRIDNKKNLCSEGIFGTALYKYKYYTQLYVNLYNIELIIYEKNNTLSSL